LPLVCGVKTILIFFCGGVVVGQSEKLYKPVLKEGTHLAKSKNTPGAVRGSTLSDENN